MPWLAEHTPDFPEPEQAWQDPDGLLAGGGALSPAWLVTAYGNGIFPWFNDDADPILWWSPGTRGVFTVGQVHASRSLRKRLRKGHYAFSMDTAFAKVIGCCAELRAATGTWITPAMRQAYVELHQLGLAHSLEVRHQDELIGGIYGVSLGRMFFGESMFSQATDGSKMALFALSTQLQAWDFTLIDCQMMTEHLASLGAHPMPRADFVSAVRENNQWAPRPGPWVFDLPGTVAGTLSGEHLV